MHRLRAKSFIEQLCVCVLIIHVSFKVFQYISVCSVCVAASDVILKLFFHYASVCTELITALCAPVKDFS